MHRKKYTEDVAQLVRASGCGSEGRGFETRLSPFDISIEKKIQVDMRLSAWIYFILSETADSKNNKIHKIIMEKPMFSTLANPIFEKAIIDYHVHDHVDTPINNPFSFRTIEYFLYLKNWIDTVQWHLEDIIRDPDIDPAEALQIKRRIDKSNQERTDMVEMIDSYFLDKYKDVQPSKTAKINTESPAWAVDRLSILALKIYHMQQETTRLDASEAHREACQKKLDILLEQKKDLSLAIDELLSDIQKGDKYMKVYKQMKMYNDPDLNPVLYVGGKK